MKFNWKTEILPLACITVIFILAAIAWPQAPESIPIHWGLTGEPDNYGGKFFGLYGMPLIVLGIYILFFFLPIIDPRHENYKRFWNIYTLIRTIIIFFFTCIQIITFLWVLNIDINMSIAVYMVAGFLLMFLGNYMGKLRQTWFVGIRSPWTLSSEESWNKTHRLGGRLFVIFGLALVIAAPFQQQWAFYTLYAFGAAFLVFLYIYSYLVWKKDPNAAPAGTRITEQKS